MDAAAGAQLLTDLDDCRPAGSRSHPRARLEVRRSLARDSSVQAVAPQEPAVRRMLGDVERGPGCLEIEPLRRGDPDWEAPGDLVHLVKAGLSEDDVFGFGHRLHPYEGERIAVQVKRHSSAVRIGAVRQVIDGVTRYGCSRGLVVTNSFFTEQAIECAGVHGVELWDRKVLSDFVDGEAPNVDSSVCAECGRSVTKGVTDWCLARPSRYGGAVFCRAHQARSKRHAS